MTSIGISKDSNEVLLRLDEDSEPVKAEVFHAVPTPEGLVLLVRILP